MKNLFGDNRMVNMLQFFRRKPVISIGTLASKLEVSERTVRNDIRQLNEELRECAVIEGEQGKYSLRIYDADRFRVIYSKMLEADDFLNSSRNRMDYVFGKLMRSEEPVLTDELAYEMNIGRTTLISDLKKLRTEIEPYGLSVVGKTNKGLMLYGSESDIRQYVIDNNYEQIYRQYPLDQEITEAIRETFSQNAFEKYVQKAFEQRLTLMLDRFLTGHYIGKLSQQYYNLTARPVFQVINELIDRIGDFLRIKFPVEEKLFSLLPVIGMHTPADLSSMKLIELDHNVAEMKDRIFAQISLEMGISVKNEEFTEEFLYHLMFMANRLRFGVHLVNPMLDDVREKYPLAYQMAEIASGVISKEYGLEVTDDERGYLAAYFGAFLMENEEKERQKFHVAVVCGTGRVTARLIAAQLKRVLDSSAQMDLFADEAVTPEILNKYDIILTTVSLPYTFKRPLIRIREIFNEQELLHKLEKVKYWDQIDVPVLDDNWFIMTGLLDETKFFCLDDVSSYDEAVCRMVEGLYDNGQVDEGFLERLREREQKGTMVFDRYVAIPHGIQHATDRMTLSIGALPTPIEYNDHEIRVIFLIGLPVSSDADDNLLIRVYDEIINIAKDEELVDKIAGADSFSALLRVLYRQAGNGREIF